MLASWVIPAMRTKGTGLLAAPSTSQPAGQRSGREAARDDTTAYRFKNSIVQLERGPAGTLARIERDDVTDWAGPLTPETIDAIEEVADGE